MQAGFSSADATLDVTLQFAELAHELLCGLPRSAVDDAEEEGGSSELLKPVACLLKGGHTCPAPHVPVSWGGCGWASAADLPHAGSQLWVGAILLRCPQSVPALACMAHDGRQ